MLSMGNHNEPSIICVQCGQEIVASTWSKRKSRGHERWDYCRDCTATPVRAVTINHPVLGSITCYPFSGDLDDDWNPVDAEGEPYLPGVRMCGNKDCVNRHHIIGQTHKKQKPKRITDLELLLTMVEVQEYNKRTRTR